jgi:hypothetical protein
MSGKWVVDASANAPRVIEAAPAAPVQAETLQQCADTAQDLGLGYAALEARSADDPTVGIGPVQAQGEPRIVFHLHEPVMTIEVAQDADGGYSVTVPTEFPGLPVGRHDLYLRPPRPDPEVADAFYRVTVQQRDAAWAESAGRQAEIERLRDALDSVRQYGSDTLSGRTDGPDDREWQRDAVLEMTNRAGRALRGDAT